MEEREQKTMEQTTDRLQGNRLEAEGLAGVQTFMEITEDELVEVQIDEQHLLELIVSPYNISRAIRKVMPNGTYGGVRGRKTKEIGGKLRKSFVFLLLDLSFALFSEPIPAFSSSVRDYGPLPEPTLAFSCSVRDSALFSELATPGTGYVPGCQPLPSRVRAAPATPACPPGTCLFASQAPPSRGWHVASFRPAPLLVGLRPSRHLRPPRLCFWTKKAVLCPKCYRIAVFGQN